MKPMSPSKQSPMRNLPLEIVNHEFFPYLDYATRIAVNSLLPQEKRKRTPLKEGSVHEFSILFTECAVKRFITVLRTRSPEEILDAFRRFDLRNLRGLLYSRQLRERFIDSQRSLLDTLTKRWTISQNMKYVIRRYNDYFLRQCRSLGEKYYPFQYEFTAVTGVGYPTIVVKQALT